MTTLSLNDVTDRYPDGFYSENHGCYYIMDYDGDAAYFIQLSNGNFEEEVNYVDFDTMSKEDKTAVLQELEGLS